MRKPTQVLNFGHGWTFIYSHRIPSGISVHTKFPEPGRVGGFDAWLADGHAGALNIDTALVKAEIPIAEIERGGIVLDAGGIKRRIRVFRMPDENPHIAVAMERRIQIDKDTDNAVYVELVQEDGHQTCLHL